MGWCFSMPSASCRTISISSRMWWGERPLFDVMKLLKGATSRHCNQILGRTGKHFWQYESYDHVVRHGSLERIIRYVIMNPVKAGLVDNWEDWPGTYLSKQYDSSIIISPN